jgi:hypothetical protein
MSSYKQKGRGRGYKGRDRAKGYRPWNAAALGKSNSEPVYDPALENLKFDSTQFRPWNAASLNKLNFIEGGSSVSSTT